MGLINPKLECGNRFWRLSVPSGNTADHPLANPFGPASPNLDPVKLDPIMVVVGGNEVMKDRIEEYYNKLREMGKEIEYVVFQGEQHGFFVNQPFSQVANKLLQIINQFMDTNSI